MSKRQRTILFLAFVLIFLLATPAVVLYTRGYRVNLAEKTIVQTGGISLTPRPIGVTVFLDGKKRDETSFLFRDSVFRNILPRTYNIRVEKEGYQSWEKFLVVEEGKVTQVKNLRLFPQKPQAAEFAKDFSFVSIAPNAQYALIVKNNKNMKRNELILQKITGDSSQETPLEITFDNITQVLWSESFESALIKTKAGGVTALYTLSIKNPANILSWNKILQKAYPRALQSGVKLYASDMPDKLIVLQDKTQSQRTMSIITLDGKVAQDIAQNITGYTMAKQNIFYLNTEGLLTKASLENGAASALNDFVFPKNGRTNTQILIRDDERAAAILQSNTLYFWQEGKTLEKLNSGIKINGMSFAPDKEKIAYWNNDEIIVHWLQDVFGPPKRIVNDIERINEFNDIRNVVWLDNDYIAVQTSSRIEFAELDSRDKRNTAFYDNITNPSVFLLGHEKNTLLMQEGVYLIQLPIE